MTDLMEFLRARLDEDERAARECAGAPWSTPIPGQIHVDAKAIADNKLALGQLGYVATVLHEQDRQHITRHDPARVLREVEAKRRIIERYEEYSQFDQGTSRDRLFSSLREAYLDACRIHAAVYADHPDYRKEWRP